MKKKILIIDDDPFVGQSLKKILQEAGHLPTVAADGQEGAARLESTNFDLLVLDLNLPGLSGFDIMDLVRLRYSSLPIVVLTGLIDQCEPGALTGADALFEKPPDVPALLAQIERLLNEPLAARRESVSCRFVGSRAKPLIMPGMFTAKKSPV